jgi:hypothetical protein
MIDDWLLSLIYAAWLAGSTLPLGLMLGSSCSPCCGSQGCEVADGKPRTDPENEGTWVPSGTWLGVGGVTWAFTANPGDDSGETWFFYGSASTSKVGGGATTAEQRDWGNICNWYSNKTNSPSNATAGAGGLPGVLDKRATRLPPVDAIVHIYTDVSTQTFGDVEVKHIYFWSTTTFRVELLASSTVTATSPAHDSSEGAVFFLSENRGVINGGALFAGGSGSETKNFGTVNDGATFNDTALNDTSGIVNDGAKWNGTNGNIGVVNGGAIFDNGSNSSTGVINGGAIFNGSSQNSFSGTVNDGAEFYGNSVNKNLGVINDGALFFDNAINSATVNDGATFYDSSGNASVQSSAGGVVNGGATFYDNSTNSTQGTVNGGATFNDAACSSRSTGLYLASPCDKKFVAHPTDLPTCNGTAPAACLNAPFGPAPICGCN